MCSGSKDGCRRKPDINEQRERGQRQVRGGLAGKLTENTWDLQSGVHKPGCPQL